MKRLPSIANWQRMLVEKHGLSHLLKASFRSCRNVTPERKRHSLKWFGNTCFYCDGVPTTFDHFIPYSIGGINRWRNLVPSCHACNRGKFNRMPTDEEFQKYLEVAKTFPELPPNFETAAHHNALTTV